MSTSKLQVVGYRVRRWTAFEWGGDMSREEREDHLEAIAGVIELKMLDTIPNMEPRCLRTRVDGAPQLLFEVTVRAMDERDAHRRAMYRFERALSAKLPDGRGRGKVRLTPPWGAVEVRCV